MSLFISKTGAGRKGSNPPKVVVPVSLRQVMIWPRYGMVSRYDLFEDASHAIVEYQGVAVVVVYIAQRCSVFIL